MAAVVLILKSTVDNVYAVVVSVVVTGQDIDKSVLLDPWQAVWLVVGNEVRKHVLVLCIHVHGYWGSVQPWLILFAVILHDIVGVVVHAEGAADLLPRRQAHGRHSFVDGRAIGASGGCSTSRWGAKRKVHGDGLPVGNGRLEALIQG